MTATTNSAAAARTGWREWMSWIRTWYVGAVQPHSGLIEGHIYPDCQRLAHQTSTPQEGAGWLNSAQGPVCASCLTRHHAGEERPA